MHQLIMLLLENKRLGGILNVYYKYTVYMYYIRFWTIYECLADFIRKREHILRIAQDKQGAPLHNFLYNVIVIPRLWRGRNNLVFYDFRFPPTLKSC